MRGIYVEIGDTLHAVKRDSGESVTSARVQCVEGEGCKDCYFRPGNCGLLLCSIGDRFDGKSVIFKEVEKKGGAE